MPKVKPLDPRHHMGAIGESKLLDVLGLPELVVYLRLLGRAFDTNSRTVEISNEDLYRNPRSVPIALSSLQERGLVVVNYKKNVRTIQVRR